MVRAAADPGQPRRVARRCRSLPARRSSATSPAPTRRTRPAWSTPSGGFAGDRTLTYDAFDAQEGEITIYVNWVARATIDAGVDGEWTGPRELLIPDDLLVDGQTNTIAFVPSDPAGTWGVRTVSLAKAALSPRLVDPPSGRGYPQRIRPEGDSAPCDHGSFAPPSCWASPSSRSRAARRSTPTGSRRRSRISSNTQLDTTGITVECPDDVKAEAGNEFDCTGTVPDSGTLTIHVKQTDDDGHVTWEVTDAATGPTGTT